MGLLLNIATPDRVFYNGPVESVVLTTPEGEMGVLSQHTHMVVALDAAPLTIITEQGRRYAALSGGFARITNNSVVILADSAEWPEEIEVNRAMEAKKRAEERLQARRSEMEYVQSQVALKRAMMRLQVVSKAH